MSFFRFARKSQGAFEVALMAAVLVVALALYFFGGGSGGPGPDAGARPRSNPGFGPDWQCWDSPRGGEPVCVKHVK